MMTENSYGNTTRDLQDAGVAVVKLRKDLDLWKALKDIYK